MLIIVEGPDGSGKTTLVNEINKKGIAKKIYGTHKDMPNQYSLWFNLMYKCVNDKRNNYIIDRCFLSDWAYRISMNDGKPYITLEEITELLKIPNVIYIFCDTDNAYELSQIRGDEYVNDKFKHSKLRNVYNFIKTTIEKFCNIKCIKYDLKKDTITNIYNMLSEEFSNETKSMD